jgi:hypothetical protein
MPNVPSTVRSRLLQETRGDTGALLDRCCALEEERAAAEAALAETRAAIRAYVLAIGRAPGNRDEAEVTRASEALVAAAEGWCGAARQAESESRATPPQAGVKVLAQVAPGHPSSPAAEAETCEHLEKETRA